MSNPSVVSAPLSRKILLNVGGDKYEVYSSWKILSRFSNSRLGKLCTWSRDETLLSELCDDYNLETMEYFFNRNSKTFGSVLSLYYTGRLHMPEGICVVAFTEDLKYWGIEESYLDSCCLHKYFPLLEQVREEAEEVEEMTCIVDDDSFGSNRFAKCRRFIWDIFERPTSSFIAKIVALISITAIVASTVVLALNSMPDFLMFECVYENVTLCEESELEEQLSGVNATIRSRAYDNWIPVENYYFALVEDICIAWFTFEYILKLLVSSNKCKFLKDLFNIFDLLSILPYYASLLLIANKNAGADQFQYIRRIIQVCRLMRTIRVFKLARHSTGLQSFLFTLGESYKELGILFLLLAMGVLLFSSFAYYAERDDNEAFESIPATFWWAAVTMNAVGLGNMETVSVAGRLVSFVCGVCGMLFVGLPIPIIVDSFATYYNKHNLRLKIMKKYKSLGQEKIPGRNLERMFHVENVVHLEQDLETSNDIIQLKSSSRLVLNVGGKRFEVAWNSVDILPNSRLSQLRQCISHQHLLKICDEYLPDSNEYIFHRDPKPFGSILNFYYTGKLHLLDDICPVAFEEELSYWEIDESTLEGCCQMKFNRKKEQIQQEIKEIEGLFQNDHENFGSSHIANLRKHIWNMLEHPSSSCIAKGLGLISIFITSLSVFILTVKTMPELADVEEVGIGNNDCLTNKRNNSFSCHDTELVYHDSGVLFQMELFCISWFGCEYILRLIASSNKLTFLRGKLNNLDPLIVLSYILTFYLSQHLAYVKEAMLIKHFCETLRIFRLLRIFKLGKHSVALEALGFTLKSNFNHLGVLLLFLAIGVLVFSSLAYIAEKEDTPEFESIPATFWWAIVTMHTVSVGNMRTTTVFGKIISFLCGLFGLLFLVLPIPIIASNFDEFYKKKMRRERAQRKYNLDGRKDTNVDDDGDKRGQGL